MFKACLALFTASVASMPHYLQVEDIVKVTAEPHTCTMSNTEKCSIANMPHDESTLVYPGSKTRCIYSFSTDYSFQVIPGDPDKMLFYFQGGGACWNSRTTSSLFCTTDAVPADHIGVFNRTDLLNRYKDYTVVQVLYCSGDVHAGNVTRDYNDRVGPQGRPVEQVGYFNTRAVVDWVLAQQADGSLGTFEDLVLMGCSAGAMGAQLWTDILLAEFSYKQAGVMSDSYLGLFSEGVEGELIYDFGYCETPLTAPSLQATCDAKQLTFEDIMMTSFPKHLEVPFGYIQSKVDTIQLLFYNLLAPLTNQISRSDFYFYSNLMMQTYNFNDNVAFYLVDGSTHCFTDKEYFVLADTCGSNQNASYTEPTCHKDPSVQWLYDWTNTLPFPPTASDLFAELHTTCSGDLIVPNISSTVTTYCDISLVPKSVTNGVVVPFIPSGGGDDDDEDEIDSTIAIAVSISVITVFIILVACCYRWRKNKNNSQYQSVSAGNAAGIRSSLLSPAEREQAITDDSLLERNTGASVEL